MIKEAVFNIHDMISFKIISQNDYYSSLNTICLQYKNFNVNIDKNNNYDFILHLDAFNPSDEDCYIIDDKYYIKYDYFYCKDSRKLSKWKLEISGFDSGQIRVNLQTNRFGKISVPLNILDFLIHFILNEKGTTIIHSSGVANNNQVFLFTARGGGGKTSIATYFTESEFGYLGDNFIILKDKHAFSFITPLNIFTYNITPLVKSNLGHKKKIILFFLGTLYKISAGYIKIFIKLDIKNLLKEKIVDKGILNSIFLIVPNNNTNTPIIENISVDDLIEHLIVNQKLEFFHLPFLNYISAISYIFPESKFSNHWEKYRYNLKKNLLGDIRTYRIKMPNKINKGVIEHLKLAITNLKDKDGTN